MGYSLFAEGKYFGDGLWGWIAGFKKKTYLATMQKIMIIHNLVQA